MEDPTYTQRYKKSEEDCAPITLIMRKYYPNRKQYYEANKEKIKDYVKSKYHNDPEYRERQLALKREKYQQKKAEKLAAAASQKV